MTNKERAQTFLRMAAAGDVEAAYARFVDPAFVHHNQYFKGDRQSLLEAMRDAHVASPNRSLEVRTAYEDGGTVITHSLVTRASGEPQQIVVVHIFRFSEGRIVELWDVGQPVMAESPNANGLF